MTRKDADLTNPEDVKKFVASQDFDICFHTAANATTAFCNEHPDLVHKINVESTQAIIDCCKEKGAKLIFVQPNKPSMEKKIVVLLKKTNH